MLLKVCHSKLGFYRLHLCTSILRCLDFQDPKHGVCPALFHCGLIIIIRGCSSTFWYDSSDFDRTRPVAASQCSYYKLEGTLDTIFSHRALSWKKLTL